MYESNIAHEKHERVILFTRSREQPLGVQFQRYCEKSNKNKSINSHNKSHTSGVSLKVGVQVADRGCGLHGNTKTKTDLVSSRLFSRSESETDSQITESLVKTLLFSTSCFHLLPETRYILGSPPCCGAGGAAGVRVRVRGSTQW